MPSLIVTVDAELSGLADGQGLWGKFEGREYGLQYLLGLFADSGAKATFFTDVYAKADPDLSHQQRACEAVVAAGHDLQLHTHPGPAFDPARTQLRAYSAVEQAAILRFGAERIREWCGYLPSMHRAGDWAASPATVTALAASGFTADFSACAWSRACGLPTQLLSGNGWQVCDGVLFCPATCIRNGLTGKLRRLDLHACSSRELDFVLASHCDPVVLVMHSFSFFLEHVRFGATSPANDGSAKFRALCDYARNGCGYDIVAAADFVRRQTQSAEREAWTAFPVTDLLTGASRLLHAAGRRLKIKFRSPRCCHPS